MATITKKELIDRIAERTQAKRVTVKSVIQAFLDEITRELGENNRLEPPESLRIPKLLSVSMSLQSERLSSKWVG
jgi:hypothetical protein